MRVNFTLTPLAVFPPGKDIQHLCGVLLIPGIQERDPHINGECCKHTLDSIRVDIPLGVKITTFDNNYRSWHCFRHAFYLAEQIPVEQGIDKIPCGFAFDEDPITNCIVTQYKSLNPDVCSHAG